MAWMPRTSCRWMARTVEAGGLRLKFRPGFPPRLLDFRLSGLHDSRSFLHRNRTPDQFLDRFQVWNFFRIAKRNCRAAGARAGGSADAVNISFRLVSPLVI